MHVIFHLSPREVPAIVVGDHESWFRNHVEDFENFLLEKLSCSMGEGTGLEMAFSSRNYDRISYSHV